jgi:hypothetical protein
VDARLANTPHNILRSLSNFVKKPARRGLCPIQRNMSILKLAPLSGEQDPEFGYDKPELLTEPIPNSRGTLVEYPQVVDVDNDGHSEIVLTSNDCGRPGEGRMHGIRAFEAPAGNWVRTRRIGNQFDYHVTNSNEDGTVPKYEKQNWKQRNLNNFRQNVQPDGLFNAANLSAVSLTYAHKICPTISLLAQVKNEGSLAVQAGLSVNFYAHKANGGEVDGLLGTAYSTEVLRPGGETTVVLEWDGNVALDNASAKLTLPAQIYFIVDEPTQERPNGMFLECDETNNTSNIAQVFACPAN